MLRGMGKSQARTFGASHSRYAKRADEAFVQGLVASDLSARRGRYAMYSTPTGANYQRRKRHETATG